MLDEYVANAGTYEKGTPEQKIADLYLSYVDEESRDAAGVEPLRPYLDAIDNASTIQEYAEAIASMEGDIGYVSLLDFGVDVDVYDVSELCGGDPQALRELFAAWASGDRRTAPGRGCPALYERFLIR